MHVGCNSQRQVMIICYQNLALLPRSEYLFVTLEKGVYLCLSPEGDEGDTVVRTVPTATLPSKALSNSTVLLSANLWCVCLF